MKLIHFRLGLFFLTFKVSGYATNDSNNSLVRFWNDGFIYSERKSNELADCSIQANKIQARDKLSEEERFKIYLQCRKGVNIR